jgi:hypothetical protein
MGNKLEVVITYEIDIEEAKDKMKTLGFNNITDMLYGLYCNGSFRHPDVFKMMKIVANPITASNEQNRCSNFTKWHPPLIRLGDEYDAD